MSTYQVCCTHQPSGVSRTRTVHGKPDVFKAITRSITKWNRFKRVLPQHVSVFVQKIGRDGVVLKDYAFQASDLSM